MDDGLDDLSDLEDGFLGFVLHDAVWCDVQRRRGDGEKKEGKRDSSNSRRQRC